MAPGLMMHVTIFGGDPDVPPRSVDDYAVDDNAVEDMGSKVHD